ncbi:hypothetical protein BURCENBC7_AP0829 [Burkholderia cenocepacia BC7]|nr:hypothetical protein BURCENK562V_C7094 [Burkholderia cenocepacia K56-2Valvano]ERI28580.1 hypothetical protein BURCENBC7_AP0829 [Burkholderia cenocepacia BC7]
MTGEVAKRRLGNGRVRGTPGLNRLLSKVISIAESVGLSSRAALID